MSQTPVSAAAHIPSWEEFAQGDRIFDALTEISRFRLFAQVPALIEFSSEIRFQEAASKIYSIVSEVVRNAGFFRLENLDIRSAPGRSIQVIYSDDVFDFMLEVQGSGTITLERSGSSLDVFHEWYVRLGPHFWDMMSKVTEALTESMGRRIFVSRAYFSFSFLLLDLALQHPQGRRVLNYEVMSRLLKGLPDDQGALSEAEDVFRSAGRVDVTFSRWLTDGPVEWVERYELQAPANRGGERIECDFSYIGETAGRSNSRTDFKAQDFFERYDTAYGQFLRNRVIRRFLTDLMSGYSFRSVRSVS